jgi:hypothetical protein
VDEVLPMGVGECVKELAHEGKGFRLRKFATPVGQVILQGSHGRRTGLKDQAAQQFDAQPMPPVRLAPVLDLGDVRMVQGGHGLRLPLETLQGVFPCHRLFQEELEGEVFPRRQILRFPHLPHRAPAKEPHKAVSGNLVSWF